MVLDTTNYIGSAVLFIRDYLLAQLTDPISSTRPTNERFVVTAYPTREVTYPIITVIDVGENEYTPSGQRSQTAFNNLQVEVRVWARNEKEKAQLAAQVFNTLKNNQTALTTGSIDFGLFDFKLLSRVPVDEDGSKGIKSNVMTFSYNLELN